MLMPRQTQEVLHNLVETLNKVQTRLETLETTCKTLESTVEALTVSAGSTTKPSTRQGAKSNNSAKSVKKA
jgi:chaperonin cofactor prefoldin